MEGCILLVNVGVPWLATQNVVAGRTCILSPPVPRRHEGIYITAHLAELLQTAWRTTTGCLSTIVCCVHSTVHGCMAEDEDIPLKGAATGSRRTKTARCFIFSMMDSADVNLHIPKGSDRVCSFHLKPRSHGSGLGQPGLNNLMPLSVCRPLHSFRQRRCTTR